MLNVPPGALRIENVLVVGAGPAGLATAIRLRLSGLDVVVHEKRGDEFNRPIRFNLRKAAVDALQEMGVGLSGVHSIRKLTFDNDVGGYVVRYKPRGDHSGLGSTMPREMLLEPSVAQVSIHDVQTALLERARALGVEVHFESKFGIEKRGEGGLGYFMNDVPLQDPLPHLIVVADGTSSDLRKSLDISFLERPGERSEFIAGTVKWGKFDGKIRRRTEELYGEVTRTIAIGPREDDRTWLLTEVPSSLALGTAAQQRRFYEDQASKIIPGCKQPAIDYLGQKFEVTQAQASRSFAFDAEKQIPLLLVGQASRTGHFLGSAGFVLATTDDPNRVEAFVRKQNGGVDRRWAFLDFEHGARIAADAWHRLGVDEFGGSQVPVNLGAPFRAMDWIIRQQGSQRAAQRNARDPLKYASQRGLEQECREALGLGRRDAASEVPFPSEISFASEPPGSGASPGAEHQAAAPSVGPVDTPSAAAEAPLAPTSAARLGREATHAGELTSGTPRNVDSAHELGSPARSTDPRWATIHRLLDHNRTLLQVIHRLFDA